jgi:hypothetical protein
MHHVHAAFFRELPSRYYADVKKYAKTTLFYWWAL